MLNFKVLALSAAVAAVMVPAAQAQAVNEDTTIQNTTWDAQTADTTLVGAAGTTITFAKPDTFIQGGKGSYNYVALFLNGVQNGSITGDKLVFNAANAATNNAGSTPGTAYHAAVLTGGSSLTIDVKELTVGARESADEKGGDRGFRLVGENNTLQIYADTIVSYTGDEFVHVREGATNVANIGSADRRIGYFEAHTGWSKNDYGVAILQANEGGTINLYAEKALLDGVSAVAGGVIGSGGWGTVNVDVNDLKIDGNLCGSYGGLNLSDDKKVVLNLRADKLDMKGDVNVGSRGIEHSNTQRGAEVSLNVDNAVIDGNINLIDTANNNNAINLTVNESATITGVIEVRPDEQSTGTSVITLGGAGDVTNSSGKFAAANGGVIAFEDSGKWAVKEWTGTNGVLTAGDSVTVENSTAVTTASTTVGDSARLVMNDGSKLKTDELKGTGGTIVVNTADKNIFEVTTNSNDTVEVALSGAQNDKYASAEEARKALGESVGTSALQDAKQGAEEGAVSDAWEVVQGADGKETIVTQANSKLAGYGAMNTLAVYSWRHELNSLQKRMGELRDLEEGVGGWARIYGSEQKVKDSGQLNRNTTVQAGADVPVGDWIIGGAFSYTDGSVEDDGVTGDLDGYAFTAYGIWQHPKGSYLDVTARYARLDSDFEAGTMHGSYDNNAWSVSVETGHKFPVGDIAFVEPQVEVIYGLVEGDSFKASNGTRVTQDDYESLIGRLGARAGFNFPENKGNLYARLSVAHDFMGEIEATATNGSSRKVEDDIGGTWVEYGIGGNFRVTPATNVYVDLERTSGGEVQENWRWTLGLRQAF